jgi:hypothetical protein
MNKTPFKNYKAIILSIIIAIVLVLAVYISWVQFIHQLGFWQDNNFLNKSGEDIEITPIGIVEGEEYIGPLFAMYSTWWWQKPKNTKLHIDDNSSRKITYDMDDQNLQFVIVKFQDQSMKILKIDAERWENNSYQGCCSGTQIEQYTIPQKNLMPECPDILKPTVDGDYINVNPELLDILNNIPQSPSTE